MESLQHGVITMARLRAIKGKIDSSLDDVEAVNMAEPVLGADFIAHSSCATLPWKTYTGAQ